jgi:hypothetical protein
VIDYDETYDPVENLDSIRLDLSNGASMGWKVHNMEVNNAFIHEDLLEDIYMKKPPRFIHNSYLVC